MPARYHRLKQAACFIVFIVGVTAGCHKRAPAVALPPVVPAVIAAAPAPDRIPPPASTVTSADGQPDEALFHLGLMYAAEGPNRDWQRATTYLRQLVTEFPRSPMKPAAELILNLHNEAAQLTTDSEKRELRIKQLTAELERLKQIDADRRKRP